MTISEEPKIEYMGTFIILEQDKVLSTSFFYIKKCACHRLCRQQKLWKIIASSISYIHLKLCGTQHTWLWEESYGSEKRIRRIGRKWKSIQMQTTHEKMPFIIFFITKQNLFKANIHFLKSAISCINLISVI